MNRKGDTATFTVLAFCSILLAIIVISISARNCAIKEFQQEAVNVGHAMWEVNKKGKVSFKWLATTTLVLPRGELYPHDKKGER